MATYLEQLASEPERLGQMLVRLVDEQQAAVGRLEALLAEYAAQLDQQVLRTLLLRQRFGAGHGEVMEAERRAEDASKPVTELRGMLERQREVLGLYQACLQEFEQTGAVKLLAASGPDLPAP